MKPKSVFKYQATIRKRQEEVTRENINKLPVELKLNIIELLGSNVYAAVTADYIRTATLLLKERNFEKYFDTRSADYCIHADAKLAHHIKNCPKEQLTRLPLLAERLFITYFESQSKDYDIDKDGLLDFYFGGEIDKSRLLMLVHGQFEDYKNSMADDYDASADRLLIKFLGTDALRAKHCLERLIRIDNLIKRVRQMDRAMGKLLFLKFMNILRLYEYLDYRKITVPECYQPLRLRKTLADCTEMLENERLEVRCICWRCDEKSLSVDTGDGILQTANSWQDLRIIIFCSRCVNCLLHIPDFDF
ncbi:LEF-7 [Alphabaculovirus myunipunctae]|uniref:LEF-7 n=1 Tax=Mythimna unipuncta nucleopolyhedrovirus TaxID=447897 RepID=A0A2K9VS89_9ABAC|nr:LEF-7 [Mythimna unipuncta nucleopolyhedrovirus]AUV65323.1 LEF-7 [Mythimna unipuncta nucleopolyhedrovirus]